MNVLLLILLMLFIILIIMYFNSITSSKIIYNENIKNLDINNNIDFKKNINKKVSWKVDANNIESYNNDIIISSNIIKNLNKLKDSYSNSVNNNKLIIASIPKSPYDENNNRINLNNIDSQDLVNEDDANIRVYELNEFDNNDKEIGIIFDNLVDNNRVEWSKIDNNLMAYDDSIYYSLDKTPIELGYTGFATY
jgi:hypothetical protein